MTEPTDAELDVFVEAYFGNCGPQATRVYSFARAVLAKWGQPAQKTVTVVPAQAAESRTIPDREIPGIVERALQELEGLVKYATSTYGHWDMRRAKGALSDLEWWARRKLAAHAQAAEPVAWAHASMGDWGYKISEKVLKITRHAQPQHGFVTPLYMAPQPVAREPLSDEQIEALPMWKRFVGLWPETRREIVRIIEAQHGIKGVQHGDAKP